MNKILLIVSTFLFTIVTRAQDFHGRYEPYMDEEDIANQIRQEKFQFTNFEYGSILVGAILLILGWSMIKRNTADKKEEGCLPIGMLLLGFVLISPLIIGLLGVVNNIIYFGIILGLIGFGCWILIQIINDLKTKK